MRKPIPLGVRFWAKVNKTDTCWLWTGTTAGKGYGQIYLGRGEGRAYSHRVSWEWENGPIPHGLFVLHRCDTPACVRPDHLFVGTQAENLADMTSKGRAPRWRSKLTHCKRGHPFDEANTHIGSDGKRVCRTCKRETQRLARAA